MKQALSRIRKLFVDSITFVPIVHHWAPLVRPVVVAGLIPG